MVFLRVIKNGFSAFNIAGYCFNFNQRTFAFIANHKINLQPGIFVEIIKLSTHFGKYICDKVFENCTLITEQITSEDIKLSTILQHTYEQTHIAHIYFENVLLGIPVQRKLGNRQIIAS